MAKVSRNEEGLYWCGQVVRTDEHRRSVRLGGCGMGIRITQPEVHPYWAHEAEIASPRAV